MFSTSWPIAVVASFLMSCGPATQVGTQGSFRTPTPDGSLNTNLIETQSDIIENTISLVAGRQEGAGLRAYAGIRPNQPIQAPLLGEATFRGPYSVAFIEDIAITNNFVRGRNSLLEGTITLRTDLSQMTVFGTDDILTIRAHIQDGNRIEGEIEVLDVPGILQGEIGNDRVFGAFHGGDPTHLLSGGFVANRQP
jgi:hypothetical protein